ncbi:MAG TPA: hypothetical protein VK177_08890 [Flavobacteriales bacterium]|nr:hypothetical protein [Flavobacteriales bacterium]
MKKQIVGKSIINLQYNRTISIFLDQEYSAKGLELELKVQKSLYLKSNSINIQASSYDTSVTRELIIDKYEESFPLKDLNFDDHFKIKTLKFSCNYDIILELKVFYWEGCEAKANLGEPETKE